MRCDSRVSFLARNLASPCLGREPKVRVETMRKIIMVEFGFCKTFGKENLKHHLLNILNNEI
jgi:hypothetical protein